MIKVVLPSRTLALSFHHQKKVLPITENFKLNGPTLRVGRSTKCEIWQLPSEESKSNVIIVLATGIAKCDERDNFAKGVGRKVALNHAIWQLNGKGEKISQFTKFERTAIWDAYHNRGVEDLVLQLERSARADIDGEVVEVENDSLGG